MTTANPNPDHPQPQRFTALALQSACRTINRLSSREAARKCMADSLERIAEQIRSSLAFIGPQVRLVVLPEYFLTGFPMGETVAEWQDRACLESGGAEYTALAAIAEKNNIYLSGNAYELDSNFPELFFQVSFVLAPNGDRILHYRRLISMFSPTPHDVLDRFLELYGAEALFPVADTELGRLAAVASEEILYPELSRALALKGAEILCHSSSESGAPMATPKNIAKQARAFENHCYVVSANSGGMYESAIPKDSANGGSRIVDYEGRIVVESGPGESMLAHADVDIAGLRHYRSRPGMFNIFSRQRLELFAPVYAGNSIYPANTLLEDDRKTVRSPDRKHYLQNQAAVIRELGERGLI